MARILIIGAGAIGGMLGARLHLAGEDVSLLARGETLESLRTGLTVEGHTTFEGQIPVVEIPEGSYDFVVLTTKAHQTLALAPVVAEAVGETGIAVSMQNGLGNVQRLAKVIPTDRIVAALTSHGVLRRSRNHLIHTGFGRVQVGPFVADGKQAAESVQELLSRCQFEPSLLDDARGAIWAKAIVNHGLNPVAGLFDCTNGHVLADPDKRGLAVALAKEATELAKRANVQLPFDPVQALLDTMEATATNTCSMLADLQAERPTEIEQISGRMVRLGEQLLVSMPRSDFVYGRLKEKEMDYLGLDASQAMCWQELDAIHDPF